MSNIDLSKPVYCGIDHYAIYVFKHSETILRDYPLYGGEVRYWHLDGKPLGDWPPLVNATEAPQFEHKLPVTSDPKKFTVTAHNADLSPNDVVTIDYSSRDEFAKGFAEWAARCAKPIDGDGWTGWEQTKVGLGNIKSTSDLLSEYKKHKA